MSSAFIRSTIEVRHSSFSPLAFTAWSRMGATSTVAAAGAAAAPPDDPAPAAVPPPAGAASALVPKIALIIFPKMLIVRSQESEDGVSLLAALFGRQHHAGIACKTIQPD